MATVASMIQLFDDGTTMENVLIDIGIVKRPRGRPRKTPTEEKVKRPRGRPAKPDIVAGSPEEAKALESARKHYEAVRRANKKYYDTHRETILEKLRQGRQSENPKN